MEWGSVVGGGRGPRTRRGSNWKRWRSQRPGSQLGEGGKAVSWVAPISGNGWSGGGASALRQLSTEHARPLKVFRWWAPVLSRARIGEPGSGGRGGGRLLC